MVITPDNKTLIISESFTGKLLAFDIGVDGSLVNRRVWADGVAPDGICTDAEGAIWTSTHTRCWSPKRPRPAPAGRKPRVRIGGGLDSQQ